MALKPTITAFEFGDLPEEIKKEYQVQTDGSYKLDLGEGVYVTDKDPAGLMSALENERNQHKQTKEHLDRLESDAKKAKEEAELASAKTKDEIKELFKSQMEEQQRQFEERLQQEKEQREKQLEMSAEQHRRTVAHQLATDLAGKKAPILLPHILEKMSVKPASEFGAEPTIEYLNSQGQPDLTMNTENFKKSFLQNDLFSDIIVASQASGGSANGGTKSVPRQNSDGTSKGFNDYSPGELMALRKENPDEYDRLKTERDSK